MPDQTDKRDSILETTLRLIVERGRVDAYVADRQRGGGRHGHDLSLFWQQGGTGQRALSRTRRSRVHRAMLEAYEVGAPLRQRFFRIWRNLFQFYLANPELFQFLDQYSLSPVITPESKETGMRLWQEPIRLFEEGHAQQIFKDMPIQLLMLIANAPLVTLVRGQIEGRVQLDEQNIEATIGACWDAVKL